jgi:hypothetical protein
MMADSLPVDASCEDLEVPYCNVTYRILLHCIVVDVVLSCTVLYCTALYYTVMHIPPRKYSMSVLFKLSN